MSTEKKMVGEVYYPAPEVIAHAHVPDYEKVYAEAAADLPAFWGRIAANNFEWYKPWDSVLDDSNAPFYKWFDGAQVNIVTKSGTKDFRGMVWEFLRNDNFQARNFFDINSRSFPCDPSDPSIPTRKACAPQYNQNQFGGNLGGPIASRTFFFANGEAFRQRRGGYNLAEFRIWKFRTMSTLDDGEHVVQAQRNDARLTAIGGFLRRFNLDELPQLINVLKGEMSIVGPRPHALAHDKEATRKIEAYSRRLNVRPGITGWAQVNGFRGPTLTVDLMQARLEHDLYYIENWSLLLDVKILILTLFRGFGQNAY